MFKENMRSTFKVKSQIYSFINEAELVGDNLKYNRLYNKLAWSYNLSQRIYFWFKFGSEKKFREPILNELDIKDGYKVLEVSTGTADNFRFLNRKAEYFGADISMGMLLQARKHLKRWKINGTLVHCEGENLPFTDNFFDVVFHCGGINFFNDKQKAIHEMIRVAKPGTKLLIVDETERLIKENYQKNPFIKRSYTDSKKAAIPVNLIPSEMENIQSDIICKEQIYKITFTKPEK
jgi:ubiquinone/menaquinone biosynthesis C-methylase UbiE